ncbi:hypothetical protein B4U80_12036, partial [Leptotrombidium deliense]
MRQPFNRPGPQQIFPRTNTGAPRCFNCRAIGHIARWCPLNRQEPQWKPNPNFQRQNVPNQPTSSQEMTNLVTSEDDKLAAAVQTKKVVTPLVLYNVEVNGFETNAIIDTGSIITLISRDFCRRLGLTPSVWKGPDVKGICGTPPKTDGSVAVDIKFMIGQDSQLVSCDAMVISTMAKDILIGNDILRSAYITIRTSDNTLSFDRRFIKKKESEEHTIYNLHLADSVLLQPTLSTALPVVTSNKKTNEGVYATVSAAAKLQTQKISIPDQTLHVIDRKSILNVCNMSNEPKRLPKGTLVATYSSKSKISHAAINPKDVATNSKDLKQYLEEMCFCFAVNDDGIINNTICDLKSVQDTKIIHVSSGQISIGKELDAEQSLQLKNLCQTFSDRFAFDESNLGKTSVCKHEIDIGSNKPFNLPPYRTPLQLRDEVDKQLQQ